MTIRDIISIIERFAPLELQLEWDNSGMQVGNLDNEATGALLTLDVTEQTLRRAEELGVNLIISHHPLIFSGLRSITNTTPAGRIVIQAIQSDISIYSAHTNIDATSGGVSWAMAERLALNNIQVLNKENGLGCIGELSEPKSFEEFVSILKDAYQDSPLRVNSRPRKSIKHVAVIGGSGSSEITTALNMDADAVVTGDLKYHDFQKGDQEKIALFDIGHFESEVDVLEIFMDIIKKKYPTFVLHIEKEDFIRYIL